MLVNNTMEDNKNQSAFTTDDESVCRCRLNPIYDRTIVDRLLHSTSPQKVIMTSLIGSILSGTVGMAVLIDLYDQLARGAWWAILLMVFSVFFSVLFVFLIQAHQQRTFLNEDQKSFKVGNMIKILLC